MLKQGKINNRISIAWKIVSTCPTEEEFHPFANSSVMVLPVHAAFFYGFCENDSEMILLKEVIGFAMFDKPTEEPRKSNEFTGYAKDKLEYINAVYKKVVEFQKEKNDVLMTFVYVSLIVKEGDGFGVKDVPVFRIPNPNVPNGTYFVDSIGRVYKSWQDFLCNNVLPAGRVCYPKEGVYSGNSDGQVIVDFRLTPAAKVTAKALKVTDITTSVASVAAGIGLFFPPVAVASIVAGGAAGLYGIVRSSVKLADRGKHGQKLGDKEAFLLWFSLAGSALGVGSAGLTTTARIAAQSAPKLLSQVVKGVNVFSVVVNGASVGGNVGVMIEEKDWDKQRIKILLNAIKEFVISLGPLVLEPMCDALTAKFGHTPLVKAIVWVLGFVNICPEDAEKIYKMALILIDVFHIMWQESKRITQSKWGNKISCKSNFSTNDDNDYCGERFVERFFHTIQSKRNNTRQVFHFPSDHRSWSDKGMLQLEEYNKIAQKILDVPDLQGSEIIYEGQTVYVHCGSVGAVSITSVVHKSIIVVEKFDIESTISAIENFQLRTSITN